VWCSFPCGNATYMHAPPSLCVPFLPTPLARTSPKYCCKLIFLACSPQCQLHCANPGRARSFRSRPPILTEFRLVSAWLIKRSEIKKQTAIWGGEGGRRKWFGAASGTFCVCGGRVYFCGPEPVDKDDWPFIVLTEHTNWFLKEQVTRRQPE